MKCSKYELKLLFVRGLKSYALMSLTSSDSLFWKTYGLCYSICLLHKMSKAFVILGSKIQAKISPINDFIRLHLGVLSDNFA